MFFFNRRRSHQATQRYRTTTTGVFLGLEQQYLAKIQQKKPATPFATSFFAGVLALLDKIVGVVSSVVIVVSILIAMVVFAPQVFYSLTPANQAQSALASEQQKNLQNSQQNTQQPPKSSRYIPQKDTTLPEGDWLVIPRIGVRTELLKTDNPDEALMEGVWKVPGYGLPGQLDKPIILVAHRYGWEWWWQSDYWRYNSFYYLPETEPGDRVEVISDQHKWVYEIYAGEEGTEISDYDADMILYTCKYLTSPVRHFRYARLVMEE